MEKNIKSIEIFKSGTNLNARVQIQNKEDIIIVPLEGVKDYEKDLFRGILRFSVLENTLKRDREAWTSESKWSSEQQWTPYTFSIIFNRLTGNVVLVNQNQNLYSFIDEEIRQLKDITSGAKEKREKEKKEEQNRRFRMGTAHCHNVHGNWFHLNPSRGERFYYSWEDYKGLKMTYYYSHNSNPKEFILAKGDWDKFIPIYPWLKDFKHVIYDISLYER